MKTLKDHTLIYDDECPMCKLYTGAFIQTGMLDSNGRKPYSELNEIPELDRKRACNEIALVNTENRSVIYGIDSLFTVISHSFPIFSLLFRHRLFRAVCHKLYYFISFNRKVIAPGSFSNKCVPDFNFKYRWLYIVVAWLLTSFILSIYSELLFPIIAKSHLGREFVICAGQLAFQYLALLLLGIHEPREQLNYFGHMMTVSLQGALLLTPALLLSHFYNNPHIFLIHFLIVLCYMLIIHVQRVKLLNLPHVLSATWLLFRLIAFFIILTLL